jgi:hypothetical protein
MHACINIQKPFNHPYGIFSLKEPSLNMVNFKFLYFSFGKYGTLQQLTVVGFVFRVLI